ncbi:hypothetical protein FRB95_012931 [Tulasnella sp. JGI-2019a]|nr:hypothetical protein FRB95_012931 [Tulasnella sp. JGI-2019a]
MSSRSLSLLAFALFGSALAAPQVVSTTAPVSSSVVASSTHAVTTAASKNPVVNPPAHTPTYSATYTFGNLPNTTETGQTGTNNCGTVSSSSSKCQNLFINSVTDFCLYGPPSPNTISMDEEIEVAYCLNEGYGTRVFPPGTILGAHFVHTPDYVQVTGNGDFTKIGVTKGDAGGELDPHGATGNGNPIGGLVFGNTYGKMQQYHEWTNFMSVTEFCFRACNPAGTNPAAMCQHIYDLQGCHWNMPANYDDGYFENCLSDSSLPMGVYGTSTWQQSIQPTPPAHPVPSSSSCVRVASLTPGSVDAAALATGAVLSASTALTTMTVSGSVVVTDVSVVSATSTSVAAATATGTGTAKTGTAAMTTATSSSKSGAEQTFGSMSSLWSSAAVGLGVMVGAVVAL